MFILYVPPYMPLSGNPRQKGTPIDPMEPIHHAFCNYFIDRPRDYGLDALRARIAGPESGIREALEAPHGESETQILASLLNL